MFRNSSFRSIAIGLIAALLAVNSPLALLAQTPQTRPDQSPRPTQNPSQNPAQTLPETRDPAQDPDNVVRISTQLVQIDAVVTDGKGNHVDNLTEDDFTLTVDGKKQTLTFFKSVKQPEAKK
ncbi:MAG: hypothetical protein M3X11_17175, partial [Acidobacteriota bacterium]|nr:hypothetical protein [Acidobacteriota bacterium]